MKHGTSQECVAHDTFSLFHQLLDCIQLSAVLVDARTIDSTLDFQLVFETVQHGAYVQYVTVHQLEYGVVDVVYRMDLVFTSVPSSQADVLGIGISGKISCIFNQGLETFSVFHFIEHRSFYITLDVY